MHVLPRAASVCIVLYLFAAPFAQAAATTIYRCIEHDAVTYSDRPCGSTATEYEANEARISILEVAPPAIAKRMRTTAKQVRSQDGSIAIAQAKRSEQCSKLERSLREIRSKMRAGYDAKEGERLKERQRKLTAQQRDLKC